MITGKRAAPIEVRRRGALMVWMAMLLVFLLTMVAFAVDLSYMFFDPRIRY